MYHMGELAVVAGFDGVVLFSTAVPTEADPVSSTILFFRATESVASAFCLVQRVRISQHGT
jgi:hypothetical protein